jgi:hypothetical protein
MAILTPSTLLRVPPMEVERFKHRQLAPTVGPIVTITGRIRRTFINKINLLNVWLVYSETRRLPTKVELNFYLHGRKNRRVTSTYMRFFPRSLPDETESGTESNCKQEAQLLAVVGRAHTSPVQNGVSSFLTSRTNSGSNTSKQQIDFSKSTEVLRTCMRLLHMQS